MKNYKFIFNPDCPVSAFYITDSDTIGFQHVSVKEYEKILNYCLDNDIQWATHFDTECECVYLSIYEGGVINENI